MPEIRVESLSHVYSQGTPFEKVAIDQIDLTIGAGEFVAVLGHTGSGKSTFVQHLNGLLSPTSGRILLDGQDIHRSKHALHDVRFQVGLVFQYPEYQLFEETVYDDIAFGPKNMKLSGHELEEHIRVGAKFAGVDESLFPLSPLDLSGGQKRRVAIAGVMAMEPGILILDEPTAGLDPAGCQDILDNIRRYRDETGATILLVTHDMSVAARIADRVLVLSGGKVAFDGTPQEVFAHVEELRTIGLDIPGSTSVAEKLRALGFSLPESICTVSELRDAILALKGGAAAC
ncbi:MAG: energy-coupling factor transporter ATPase [Ruminococcaceae bacterium]|nr:energy-coupling factor transporter ATPase [Oscillospiraceae bacterium]